MSYNIVAADPAWKFGDTLPGKKRGAAKHYNVMSTEDICALRLPGIASSALLFLWYVPSFIEDAVRVARSWGFVPKSELIWVKLSKDSVALAPKDRVTINHGDSVENALRLLPLHFGMGWTVRMAHEPCMIATRGDGHTLVTNHSTRSVFFAPTGEHSEKPDAFYAIVESLTMGSDVERVDLFSRRDRTGWTSVGDSLGTRLTLPLEGA